MPASRPTSLCAYSSVRNRQTLARGHDIGARGMAIYIPLQIAVGTPINLSFQLPYSRTVFGIRAIVRSHDGFRYGVEFVDLTPTEAEEIKRVTYLMELAS